MRQAIDAASAVLLTAVLLGGCASAAGCASPGASGTTTTASSRPTTTGGTAPDFADVTRVAASGDGGDLTFAVTVRSPDTGCGRYADWWEVLRADGFLLARRILIHSHVDEQPFTRSQSSIDVQPGETLIVRAHMNPGGYGGQALRGSVEDGFVQATDVSAMFAPDVERMDPQPGACAF